MLNGGDGEIQPMLVKIPPPGRGANLNVHLHIIVLDGSYEDKITGRLKFYTAKAPTTETTTGLVPTPKFHLTRYYGVLAKASEYHDQLPDRPQAQLRAEQDSTDIEPQTIQVTLTAMNLSPRPPALLNRFNKNQPT